MTPTEILALVQSHQWLALSPMVIGYLVWQLKEGQIGPVVPAKYRRALAFALGLLAGALQMVIGGATWQDAALTALAGPLAAIFGHHAVVDGVRGGREVAIPKLTRATASSVARIGIVLLMLWLVGCAGSFEIARQPSLKLGAPPPSARCIKLDDRHAFYGGSSKLSAALSGVAGVTVLAMKTDDGKLALGATSGGLAAVAVGAGFVADSASTSWARECAK